MLITQLNPHHVCMMSISESEITAFYYKLN